MTDINRDAFEASYLEIAGHPGLGGFVRTSRKGDSYAFNDPMLTLIMNSAWWAWQSGQLYVIRVQHEMETDHVVH